MAHYYASVTGSRGTTVTKSGTKASGMDAHIRGWDVGVEVVSMDVVEGADDLFSISMTNGSNGEGSAREVIHLGHVTRIDGKLIFLPAKA